MVEGETLRRLAERALAAGQWQNSSELYSQIIAAGRDIDIDHFNLGYLRRCERRYPDALAHYRTAILKGVHKPEEALLNMAAIQSERLNDQAGAIACLEEALSVNPRFIPAMLNLGLLFEDTGQADSARVTYDAALKIAPDCGQALAKLAIMDIFDGNAHNRLEEIQALLRNFGTPLKDAIDLGFAEGHILDALGEFDAAFDAFARANEYVEEDAADLPLYDPAQQERFVESITRLAPHLQIEKGAPTALSPVFICGMFRSGSSLLEALLARHSKVTAAGELEIIPAMAAQQLRPYPECLVTLSTEEIAALRDQYFAELFFAVDSGKLLTDKRPDNFLHIGLIKAIFPEAKIINTVRNKLDNILSVYFGNFDNSIRYGTDLQKSLHWYHQYEELMAVWKSVYGDDIHDVSYEALVTDTEATLKAALNFCGLEWEESCATAATAITVKTPSNWQVRQPVHTRSAGRWRNYEKPLIEREMLPEQSIKK